MTCSHVHHLSICLHLLISSKTGWQWWECHCFCSNLVSKYWTYSTFDLTSLKVRFDYDLALQEGHECLDINYQTILPIAVNKFLIVRVTQINSLGTINVENILVICLWEPTVWLTLTSISCYGARLAKATLYHGTKVHKTGTQLHDTWSRWSTHSVFTRAGFSTQAGRQWRQQYQEGSAKIRIQKKNNQWSNTL